MRIALATLAAVLASLLSGGIAVSLSQPGESAAQQPGGLVVLADVVSGVLGPTSCALQSRFAPSEKVIFRVRVLDNQTGEMARNAQVTVHFADGAALDMHLGPHPGRGRRPTSSGPPGGSCPTTRPWASSATRSRRWTERARANGSPSTSRVRC